MLKALRDPLLKRAAQDSWELLDANSLSALATRQSQSDVGIANPRLGILNPTHYEQFAVRIEAGDLVVLYTDVLIEAPTVQSGNSASRACSPSPATCHPQTGTMSPPNSAKECPHTPATSPSTTTPRSSSSTTTQTTRHAIPVADRRQSLHGCWVSEASTQGPVWKGDSSLEVRHPTLQPQESAGCTRPGIGTA